MMDEDGFWGGLLLGVSTGALKRCLQVAELVSLRSRILIAFVYALLGYWAWRFWGKPGRHGLGVSLDAVYDCSLRKTLLCPS